METLWPVDVLSRWVHVGTSIVVVGGSVFIRFVLMPAAAQLPDDAHNLLRERVLDNWRRLVRLGIGLFLISGLYNFARAMPKHQGDALYHSLMGVKILVAFVVFFLAAALTSRSQALERIRQDRKKWTGIMILLAAMVVALAGTLKVAVPPQSDPDPQPSANTERK